MFWFGFALRIVSLVRREAFKMANVVERMARCVVGVFMMIAALCATCVPRNRRAGLRVLKPEFDFDGRSATAATGLAETLEPVT